MAGVSLEHVWKIYRAKQKQVAAVRDVSLEIEDGEFVAFLGPSGCGKTSILRMIAGLEDVSQGTLRIGERVVNDVSPMERNIAMAFETYALYPNLSVRDNLGFCLRARSLASADIDARVNEMARVLHLETLLDKRPPELAGGQQQLVSVARALIREPNVFLLDEPLSHLDASVRIDVRTQIKRIARRLHTTTIYVTHDQHEAIALADRIVVMNVAEVQQAGSAQDLFHRPVNMFVAGFVGEPSINFIPCVPRRDNGTLQLECTEAVGRFPVQAPLARTIESENLDRVIVGIRPNELSVVPEGKGDLQGTISFFEFIGEEGHLIAQSGTAKVTLVTEPYLDAPEGKSVGIGIRPEAVLIFDPKSGRALNHNGH